MADLPSLAITAAGVVVGFPLFTALALQHVTSAHSIVFVGLLPLCTAAFAVLRGGERPRPLFWVFSAAGAAVVAGYAAMGGAQASLTGDLLMLAAVVGSVVMGVIAALRTSSGQTYRYPWRIQILR